MEGGGSEAAQTKSRMSTGAASCSGVGGSFLQENAIFQAGTGEQEQQEPITLQPTSNFKPGLEAGLDSFQGCGNQAVFKGAIQDGQL